MSYGMVSMSIELCVCMSYFLYCGVVLSPCNAKQARVGFMEMGDDVSLMM